MFVLELLLHLVDLMFEAGNCLVRCLLQFFIFLMQILNLSMLPLIFLGQLLSQILLTLPISLVVLA